MAEFKPGTGGNIDTNTAMFATQITGLKNGEALDFNQPLNLRTDGKLWKSSGQGVFVGIAPTKCQLPNQALTVYGVGLRFHARDEGDLNIGALYYLGATAGYISDAATANDAQGAFVAVSKHDLMVVRIGKLT